MFLFGVNNGDIGCLSFAISNGLLLLFLLGVMLCVSEGNGDPNDVSPLFSSFSMYCKVLSVDIKDDFTPSSCCRIMMGESASRSTDGDELLLS